MSGRLVGMVFENAPRDLTTAERMVLLSLAESARDRTRVASYDSSVEALARRTRVAPGTVKNVLSALVRYGLIQRVNGRAHEGLVQHYAITELHEHHRDVETKKKPTTKENP